jgi:hypothetical protein
MKFYFRCLRHCEPTYEVEADDFEGACLEFGRLRRDGKPPDEDYVLEDGVASVTDEAGTKYDRGRAEEVLEEVLSEEEEE